MKSKFILQLFAENPAADSEPGGADPAGTDPKDAQNGGTTKPKDGELKYSDKDLDEIINKKFAKWQEKQQKAVDQAKRLAEMSEQEKAEFQRDELQKELDEYKRKDLLAKMTKTARKMLSDSGIVASDELLSVMVSTNADETKAAVDGFAKLFNEAVENAVKARLKGAPPPKGSSGAAAPMTKEQIMAIRDPELRQRKMLENKELFNF